MPNHNTNLNDKQILILKLAYKFRYLTTDTLSRRLQRTHFAAYNTLNILYDSGYLHRVYDKSFKLQNKSARYCLTTKAVQYLSNESHGLNKRVLSGRRYEQNKSAEFMDQQVAIFKAYLDLKDSTPDELVIFTATEMTTFRGFLRPLPNLFVQNKTSGHIYFIELTDGQHLFLVKKRIRKYIDHYQSDVWTGADYPQVVFVRALLSDRRRLKLYAENQMEDKYLDEDEISFKVVNKALFI